MKMYDYHLTNSYIELWEDGEYTVIHYKSMEKFHEALGVLARTHTKKPEPTSKPMWHDARCAGKTPSEWMRDQDDTNGWYYQEDIQP